MTPEDLLNTLDDLGDGEFKKFKWFLQQADIVQGLPTIKKSRLEMTNRWDTVDLMVQTYRLPGAVKMTRKVLERISRNDLLLSLSASRSRPEGESQEDINRKSLQSDKVLEATGNIGVMFIFCLSVSQCTLAKLCVTAL